MSRQEGYGIFAYIIPLILVACIVGVGLMGGAPVLIAVLMPLILICVFAFTPFGMEVPFWQKALLLIAFFIIPYAAVRLSVLPMVSISSTLPLSTITLTYDVDMMYAFALVVISILVLGLFTIHTRHRGGK